MDEQAAGWGDAGLIPAELAEEALIWEWQKELEIHGLPDSSARPVVAWADEWTLKLTSLPDALLEISLNSRILADTGIPLKNLSADASWNRTLERFAESTLRLLADRPRGNSRYFMLFDPIMRSDEFPAHARVQFNAVVEEVNRHMSEEMDTPLFEDLLRLWEHGAE